MEAAAVGVTEMAEGAWLGLGFGFGLGLGFGFGLANPNPNRNQGAVCEVVAAHDHASAAVGRAVPA